MSLAPTTRLGPYEIVAAIGAGGMGEVFRARDTTLNRDVAIKVLPAAMATNTERMARFKREAQVLASLNHPNIAHVYGFEGATLADGATVHFLAMELVEGEDLAERLKRGAIPVEESIAIAKQIAGGLEEAHEHGIIHRDLKPANVKVTPDGKVKVLDFGLAKALEGDSSTSAANSRLSHSPTMSRHATEAGMILGTAAYMSPEQARGKTLDKRADIWAFGVLLFEMLTGTRLFAGETVSDTLAAVLTRDPDWNALPPAAPAALRRLLRRCLERDPERRLHDIADARIELEDGATEPSAARGAKAEPRSRAGILAGLLLVAAVAFVAGKWIDHAPRSAERARDLAFVVRPPGDGPAVIEEIALSRDGRRLVFRSSDSPNLLLREMSSVLTRPLPGTQDAEHPFFSPDGEWLGFIAGGKLKKVAFAGGDPIPVCDAPERGPGVSWGLDGSIYLTPTFTTGLFKVDAGGGTPVQITTPDRKRGEAGHMWADVLPGGKALVFTVFGGSGMNGSKVALLDLRSGRYEVLLEGAGARHVASGHLVFYRGGAHYAVPFDPVAGKLTGSPRTVLRDVRRPEPTGAWLQLAFSDSGQLAYVPGEAPSWGRASRLAWISRDGAVERLPFEGVHNVGDMSLSRNGQRVAVTRYADGEWQIWIYDLARGTQEKLTREGVYQNPAWHPDGNHVGYTALVNGNYDLWWSAVDASRPAEPLIAGERDESLMQWSPDGRSVIFQVYSEETGPDLMLLRLDAPAGRRSLVATSLDDSDARVSPDGRWLAYRSGDALYVSPFPGMRGRTLVGRGVHTPRWSGATRELFFIKDGGLMAVRHPERGVAFEIETPQRLFETPRMPASPVGFEVAADGKRFLFFVPLPGQVTSDEIHVKVNGFEELQALPGDNR